MVKVTAVIPEDCGVFRCMTLTTMPVRMMSRLPNRCLQVHHRSCRGEDGSPTSSATSWRRCCCRCGSTTMPGLSTSPLTPTSSTSRSVACCLIFFVCFLLVAFCLHNTPLWHIPQETRRQWDFLLCALIFCHCCVINSHKTVFPVKVFMLLSLRLTKLPVKFAFYCTYQPFACYLFGYLFFCQRQMHELVWVFSPWNASMPEPVKIQSSQSGHQFLCDFYKNLLVMLHLRGISRVLNGLYWEISSC